MVAENGVDKMDRNRFLILNTLRDRGALSRLDLAGSCGLSTATTKRLVDELITDGFLREGEPGEHSGRGRKAALLQLDGRHGYSLGVSIEPHALELRAIDFSGEGVFTRHLPLGDLDRPGMERVIVAEIRRASESCAAGGCGRLLGVGAGISGLVNARDGIVLYWPGLDGWENADLAGLLRQAAPGVEVVVDDEVRCMALEEMRCGSARGMDSFLFIYIGSGVGAGIILDGRIYRGTHGASGEFGHITIRENGPLCKCGNRGCLEALVSGPAVLARVHSALSANVYSTLKAREGEGQGLALADVYAAALEGDKLANMVVAEIEDNIGVGIANLINIFDPGTVILSGDVIANFHELILDGIRKIVGRRAMHAIAHRTVIREGTRGVSSAALGGRPAEHGSNGCAALGAATMVMERVLRNGVLNL
jgi:N-acetylglucosamine repressor